VFRSCILSMLHLANVSRTKIILFGPLFFGLGTLPSNTNPSCFRFVFVLGINADMRCPLPPLAHVHHAWDTYNRFGRTKTALKRALLTSSMYTFFFCIPSFKFLKFCLSFLLLSHLYTHIHPFSYSLHFTTLRTYALSHLTLAHLSYSTHLPTTQPSNSSTPPSSARSHPTSSSAPRPYGYPRPRTYSVTSWACLS
jgi:hypothetical protein